MALFSQNGVAQSGVFWQFAGPLSSPDRVSALVVDPRNDSVLYLASPGGGVWKSVDGGGTWAPQLDSTLSLQVCSLALDPQSPDVLYVGTGDDQSLRPAQGVGRSVDGGRNWTVQARFTDQPVCVLAVDPTNSARVFAGSGEGLFFSADAGANWERVLSFPVTSVAFDGLGNVYVGLLGRDAQGVRENILVRSFDSGRTWTNLILPPNPDAPSGQTTWISVVASGSTISVLVSYQSAVDPSRPSSLDFYRSTDSGMTWPAPIGIGQARPPMRLVADSVAGSLYVAGATLLTSADPAAGSWSTIATQTGNFRTGVFTGGMLLLGGDSGLEAVALVPGVPTRAIGELPLAQILGVSRDSAGRVWGAGPAGLFGLVSSNNLSETAVPGIGAVGSVAAANGPNIFAAGNGLIYRSTDTGLRFSSRAVLANGESRAPFPPFVLDPVNPATAYVAGTRLYRTTDSGTAWTALGVVDPDSTRMVIALALAPTARTVLYAATACLPEITSGTCPPASLIWRSANGGASWSQMGTVSGLISRLAIDPRQVNTIYAAIGAFPGGPSPSAGFIPGELLRSTNGGAVWASVRGNLPATPVNTIVIDPASLPAQLAQPAQRLYVGTDAGVFVSFDAGVQWTDISLGLPPSPITDLSLQPGGLLAATFGRGMYGTSTAGLQPGVIANPLSWNVTIRQGATIETGIRLTNASTTTASSWRLSALDSWISVPEPAGILLPGASSQVSIRVSATGLQTAVYRGRLQLVHQGGAINPFSRPMVQNIQVEATVTGAPARMTIVGGNNATGAVGAALPAMQVMILDAAQLPVPGLAVSFAITAGEGSLNARTVLTNAAGIAGAVLTLPRTAGTVQVVATSGSLSATFTATAIAASAVQVDSVVDAVAFNAYTSPGPGSILSILGRNLAGAAVDAGGSPLPTLLQTTQVLLSTTSGEVALPLLSVSSVQIRALVPSDLLPGTYRLRVEVASGRSNDVQISLAAFAPAIITQGQSGRSGLFIKEDGSQVTAANPASPGSIVTFYAAGLGAVAPPVAAGQAGAATEPLNRTASTPRVFFDIYQAEVIYSGLAPGVAGRYQVTVRVPGLVSSATNISVSLTIGRFASNRVTIPVR